jgi:MFS family permease
MGRSPLAVIFLTVFIDLVGFGIVIPILPYYAMQYQATPMEVGILMSIFSLVQFVASPIWGRISDRVGRRPVIITSLTAGGLGYLAFGFAPSLPWLFAARAIAGAAGGSISAASAYIADVTKPEDRAKGMGLIGAAFGLGFIFGPAIGGILTDESAHVGALIGGSFGQMLIERKLAMPMFFAAALSIFNAILAAIRLPESLTPELREKAKGNVRRGRLEAFLHALGKPALGSLLIVSFLGLTGFSMMEATFAMLMKARMNLTPKQVGYVFAFIGVVAVIIQGGLIGRLTKRFGEWRLLYFGLATMALGFMVLTQVTHWGPLLATCASLAVGNALMTPSLNALISRTAAAHEQGGTLGVSQSAGALARIAGPSIGGVLFGVFFAWPYVAGSFLLLIAFGVAVAASSRFSERRAVA